MPLSSIHADEVTEVEEACQAHVRISTPLFNLRTSSSDWPLAQTRVCHFYRAIAAADRDLVRASVQRRTQSVFAPLIIVDIWHVVGNFVGGVLCTQERGGRGGRYLGVYLTYLDAPAALLPSHHLTCAQLHHALRTLLHNSVENPVETAGFGGPGAPSRWRRLDFALRYVPFRLLTHRGPRRCSTHSHQAQVS